MFNPLRGRPTGGGRTRSMLIRERIVNALSILGAWRDAKHAMALEHKLLRDSIWRMPVEPRSWSYWDKRLSAWPMGVVRFLGWLVKDTLAAVRAHEKPFPHYGIWLYEGRMGAGKTSGMQLQIREWRNRYPRLQVVANYASQYAHAQMSSWEDFFVDRGPHGTVYLIDEISSLWDSMSYKDFPPELLREVVQQRKDRKLIVCSAQHYTRVVKALREQVYVVIRCTTLWGRLSLQTTYDGYEYEKWHDAVVDPKTGKRGRLRVLRRRLFILDDEIRQSYDTLEKVKMLARELRVPKVPS